MLIPRPKKGEKLRLLKILLIVDSLVMVGLVILFCTHPRTMAYLSAAGILAGLNSVITRFAFNFKTPVLRTGLLAAGTVVAVLSAVLTLGSLS